MKKRPVSMLALALAGLAPSIVAREIRVAPGGNVKAIIASAHPGDTIILAAGQYRGEWKVPDGKPGKPVTLRAERPGRVFVGRPPLVRGFKRVDTMHYTWVAEWAFRPSILAELDTGKVLRHMGSIVDTEEVVASYYFDEKAGKLYVHPDRSESPLVHTYMAVGDKTGIIAGNHTVIDGLILMGFGHAAISIRGRSGVTVRNSVYCYNGYGIFVSRSRDVVIQMNRMWTNRPAYSEGAQLHISSWCENIRVERNLVFDTSQGYGLAIRGYSGQLSNVLFRQNVADGWIWFKTGGTDLVLDRNVSFGGSIGHNQNYGKKGNTQTFNTYALRFHSQASPGVS